MRGLFGDRDLPLIEGDIARVVLADPVAPGVLDPETKTLNRTGKLIMDDSDNYGVEMALQLASGEGDEVTLVSMAPGGETSGLRTGLQRWSLNADESEELMYDDRAVAVPGLPYTDGFSVSYTG